MNPISKIYNNSSFIQKIYQKSFLSPFLHSVKQYSLFLKYKFKAAKEFLDTLPRSLGRNDERFIPLKEYKDKYKGKRCFITCTGPSLTIEDLESLKNEYTFGMNSIALIHDKTEWVPDFFGVQDINVYEKIKDKVTKENNGTVFVPYGLTKRYEIPSRWIKFPMCGSYHLYEMIYGPKYFAKFSDNCYVRVYDGYSITYSLIQLAIYFGFDEIYLLGCDCNYMGEKQHFIETGHYDPGAAHAAERTFASYKVAKEYADTHGIKIINSTRGGKLEIFPRKSLEDVLSVNEKNKVKV